MLLSPQVAAYGLEAKHLISAGGVMRAILVAEARAANRLRARRASGGTTA